MAQPAVYLHRRDHGLVQWFTEGFDTADLQAARALLPALIDQEKPAQT